MSAECADLLEDDRIDLHRHVRADQQQRARDCICKIVMAAWGMVNAVVATAGRASLQANELRNQTGWSRSAHRCALSNGKSSR